MIRMVLNLPTTIMIAISALAAGSPQALARDTEPRPSSETKSISIGIISSSERDHASLGLGFVARPDYEGSDDYQAQITPLIDVKYAPLIIKGTRVGIAVLELKHPKAGLHILAGPLAQYRTGRDEGDNNALQGLGNIDDSIEVGGFMEIIVGNWATDISVGQDVASGHDGLLATLAAKYTTPALNGIRYSYGLSTNWADGDYMQNYFGVSNAQSETSVYAPYTADAGFKDAGMELGAFYNVSAHWGVEAHVGYRRLFNDAADSPLVKGAGSANQYQTLIGLSYNF